MTLVAAVSNTPRPQPAFMSLVTQPACHQRAPRHNALLDLVPDDVWERLAPHLQLLNCELGCVLYEPGTVLRNVYFPTTAVISVMYETNDGDSAEVARVGDEGVAGLSLLMGGESNSRSVVQRAGQVLRLKSSVLKQEFDNGGLVAQMLLRYSLSLITQMAQSAVCNRHHSLEQQLCRWLLLSLDRLPSNHVHTTHEMIANMVGVRRVGVTQAVGKLQRLGVIRCGRGRITVLDRPALESHVCECYAIVRRETERLMPEGHNHLRAEASASQPGL
ncbi:Crp/Fnr family transcriptional regulator [Uliginosibacterium sp. H3]|uniref:Crp/Fnr family transcriptional regulator n=1 Tax=Uliginosibacterium silvisoli TaxID=3114758 RepID=A0ABU6K7Q4_9RHOO|nr:Crp/Fnr family transcriptional regulator [Uliginosibacterium sp. H3]